ncbi:magnesium and cobalt transport protein CorA [Patulibacter defluvii]|uniref:magnesium and cobalt transport protein CorA n=1 Tax=Patulibacter defluvii TaxID=3095358 RepID=UPI002A752673|nr:magnesium and cobalt transport protein CorA [Patulibacter sp. DM4]
MLSVFGDRQTAAPPPAEPTPRGAAAVDAALTDCAVYESGNRQGGKVQLEQALQRARACEDGFVWIGLHDPVPGAVELVGEYFDLHPLAIEDAIHAHQRPKLERHDQMVFVVLKTARYVDDGERVEIGELMVFAGRRFIVTIRHGDATPLGPLRRELEANPERMSGGPGVVFHAIIDKVVDDYADVIDGLSNDVDEVEETVFSGLRENPTERIYRLKREVIAFKKAVTPLVTPITRLVEDEQLPVPDHARPYLRDVLDHLTRDAEAVTALDELLSGILQANLAQLSVRQNDDTRKISAWVAIVAVPTMVFGLYGMNFTHMPELKWTLGYPAVIVVTVLICALLFRRLRRAGWL